MKHPIYGKFVRRRPRSMPMTRTTSARLAIVVVVEQCRPLSKTKKWRFIKLIERAG